MGKEKLAAGPDVPAFPLFLQPPERCSLFSFPDGQEESDGGNCHCLITAQGPLYDGRHGRERGSAWPHRAGRAGQPGLPFAPRFGGWLWVGRAGHLKPFSLGCCVCRPPRCCSKDSQDQEAEANIYYICFFSLFLVMGLSWWMGRAEAWNEPRGRGQARFSACRQ